MTESERRDRAKKGRAKNNIHYDIQYVWGQDVDRFLKLGNFASTT
jgi:hypothetical protein